MSEALVSAVQDWSSQNPTLAPLIIVLAVAACTVSIFIPTTPLNLAAAATHGILPSAIMVCVGCTLGSVINFAIARCNPPLHSHPQPRPSTQHSCASDQLTRPFRHLARNWAQTQFGHMLAPVERVICSSPFKMIVLLRLSPVFPFSPVGHALGTMNVSGLTFAIATAIGVFPGCAIYSWMGASLKDASQGGSGSASSIASISLCVASTLAVSYVAKREYVKACAPADAGESGANLQKKK
jgi:uncharacterized membrane protein YdjX (TVP38/TMEM64 family)